jgi:hypothetical protein
MSLNLVLKAGSFDKFTNKNLRFNLKAWCRIKKTTHNLIEIRVKHQISLNEIYSEQKLNLIRNEVTPYLFLTVHERFEKINF